MGEAISRTLAKDLSTYLTLFADSFVNVQSGDSRDELAHLWFARLWLIYDLQVAGCLADGDRWYLHTQLGQHADSASGTFFKTVLQPLCHQGLGLPPAERPRSRQQTISAVPYLGGACFQLHPLEQRSPHLDLPDDPIELFLGWLAERSWQRQASERPAESDVITPTLLAEALEFLINDHTGKGTISAPATLQDIAQQTVDAHVLRALAPTHDKTLDDLLLNLNDEQCLILVTETLPKMTVLDPACGSGRLLLLALERLQTLYQACWHRAQTSTHPDLKAWTRSLQESSTTPQWQLTQQILTQNLYGIDVLPEAVTITQFQLWLQLLATASTAAHLRPLPDLDFNITPGNALVGFIRVDSESFDQILPKRTPPTPPPETILQGNLLQPLAAASYRDTLVEKKIRVEHYQAQTRAMGMEGGIPEYAQTEFLRDRIEAVNHSVQQKLNTLLFETWSRKLGIDVKEPAISGRRRKRLLTVDDIAALHPFHWGFFFNTIIEQHGGFDAVLTHAPDGSLSPKADEFYYHHKAQFRALKIAPAEFRRSRRQLLLQHPALAKAWSDYAGRIAALKDYVRRSNDYEIPLATRARRSMPLKLLLSLRCAQLTKPTSVPPYVR